MRIIQFIVFINLVSLFSCSSNDPYPITESLAKINEKQILDPMAPENNEGIVNDLDGNYGKNIVTSYQKSSSEQSEGTSNSTSKQISKSSGGN